jgi:hypothetical protein
MSKKNCWGHKKCGREPGGEKAHELGVCPATEEKRLDGTHGGKNAGRACWAVAGSLCGGKVQGTFAEKYGNCMKCDFYKSVRKDENGEFKLSSTLLEILSEKNECLVGEK